MGKLWKRTIFNGKTMEKHHFQWENYGKAPCSMGKLWKSIMFNGKTMETHHFLNIEINYRSTMFNRYAIFGGISYVSKSQQ